MDEEGFKKTCIKQKKKRGGIHQPFHGTWVADFMLRQDAGRFMLGKHLSDKKILWQQRRFVLSDKSNINQVFICVHTHKHTHTREHSPLYPTASISLFIYTLSCSYTSIFLSYKCIFPIFVRVYLHIYWYLPRSSSIFMFTYKFASTLPHACTYFAYSCASVFSFIDIYISYFLCIYISIYIHIYFPSPRCIAQFMYKCISIFMCFYFNLNIHLFS